MLQAIRDRAQGFFAWVLLILIGVPFALWGIQNYFDSGKETPVAVVGDRDIFERDVTRAYEQIIANLPGGVELEEKQLKRQALDRLIDEELVRQATREKRLIVGDEAVRSMIQTLPYFQTDGVFDKEKYKTMLASQNLSPNQFSEQMRHALALEQYQRAVSDSALASDWQVENFFRLKNQQRQIEYVTFPLRKAERPIPDADIDTYYEQHRGEFQDPETLTIDYLTLTLDDLAAQVKPTEDELRNFYNEQKGVFTVPEERRVSHILAAVESGKPEAEQAALAKIQSARERILKGEDFAAVAKAISEDTGSAAKGGDLGIVRAGMMDPSFEKAALALPKDAVSDPVRSSFGYHLIKVTSLKASEAKPFEAARPELLTMYQRHAADSRFYELGQKLTEMSYEHPDSLEPAAKAIDRTIQRSRPFTREKGEDIAAEKVIRDAAFSDDVLSGKNSELLELAPDKVAVIRVYDRRPAVEKPLTEVRSEILQRIRTDHAREQARASAEDFLKKVEAGSSAFASLAKASQLALHAPSPIRRNATDLPAPLVEAVFSAVKPKQRPVHGMVALDDGAQAVFSVNAVIEQTPAAGDKEPELLKNYLVNSAGQQQFEAWMAELRKANDVSITLKKD